MKRLYYSDYALKKFRVMRQRGRISKLFDPAFFDFGIYDRRKKERKEKQPVKN